MVLHLRDALELLERHARTVLREWLHAGVNLPRPAPPALVEHPQLGAREQELVVDPPAAPRRLVVGEVAAQRVVDGPALLGREDNDLTVLLAGAGDLDLTE